MKYIIFLLLLSFHAYSGEQKKNILMFGPGLSDSIFKVDSKDGKTESKLVSSSKIVPFIGYTTMPRPFWSSQSWLRGSLEIGLTSFKADLQTSGRLREENGLKPQDGVDLGSSVKGYSGFINPTLILFLGATETFYFYAGLGLGIGFSSMKGNYYETDGSNITSACRNSFRPSDVRDNCLKKSADHSGVDIAANTTLVASMGWLGLRLDLGGPTVTAKGKEFTSYQSTVALFGQYRF